MVEVRSSFAPQEDKDLVELLEKSESKQKYNPEAALFMEFNLLRLTKTEDWFKDGTTLVRTLRKGRGRNPFIDSTVKIRMKIIVNDKLIVSNYPEKNPKLIEEEAEEGTEPSTKQDENAQPYDLHDSEDLGPLSIMDRADYIKRIEN